MQMYFDFSVILGAATLLTGGLWLIDSVFFKKSRLEKTQAILETLKIEGVNLKKTQPEDLDKLIQAKGGIESAPRMAKWAEYARSFFPVLLFVFVLRAFIAEPFRIPSGSMRPTLVVGDFILVNKFQYGLRMPLTATKLVPLGEPKRGDIIVFRHPQDASMDLIKRVIGLPGDKVKVIDKKLYINEELVNEKYVETKYDAEATGNAANLVKLYQETLPGGVEHDIYLSEYARPDYAEVTVPEGHYFAMGDNRDFSGDSREWGFVPEKLILGKAIFIWFSFDTNKKDVRWSRLGRIGSNDSSKKYA